MKKQIPTIKEIKEGLEARLWEIWTSHHDFGEELDREGAIQEILEAFHSYLKIKKLE